MGIDVTKVLNEFIKNNGLENVTGGRNFNDVFGDVHPGKHKKLVVRKGNCLQEFGPDHPEHWGKLNLEHFFNEVRQGHVYRKPLTPRKGDSEVVVVDSASYLSYSSNKVPMDSSASKSIDVTKVLNEFIKNNGL